MSTQVYQASGGGTVPLPNPTVLSPRDPTTSDIVSAEGSPYQVLQGWKNTTSGAVFEYAGGGIWVEIIGSGGSGPINTINSNAAIAGNYILAGTANQITIAQTAGTSTFSLPAAVIIATSVTSGSFITSSATLGTTFTANSITPTGSNANIDLLVNGKGSGGVIHSRGLVGGDVTIEATNTDNTNAASRAGFEAAVGGTSSGDPYFQSLISGGQVFSWGIDNSTVADDFVISKSASLGTSNQLVINGSTGALLGAASITATTTLTATLGAITATNGNLVLGTAGNKILSTSVATTIAAGANSFGSVALAGGTATVSTSAVTANSLIVIWRQSIGATGAAALGHLSVGTIVAATSFIINALQAADATALQASDVSVVGWMIIN